MGIFSRAFWGAFWGRFAAFIFFAFISALGFSAPLWAARVVSWWTANPAHATVIGLQIAGAAVGFVSLILMLAPPVWRVIRPRKFKLRFDPAQDIDAAVQQFNAATGQPLPNRATFVHVNVEAQGSNVTTCAGAVTCLERLDEKEAVVSRLDGTRQLIWAPREVGQVQQIVAPGLPQDLDLFRINEGTNRIDILTVSHPQSWADFFDQPGLYRVTVSAYGGEMSENIKIRLSWRGKWNDFDISVEPTASYLCGLAVCV